MAERVRITVGSGKLVVIGETRVDVTVEGATTTVSGEDTAVTGGSKDVTIRVPAGTDVVAGTESGDVRLEGSLGAVSVTTSSANVHADEVASIDARTQSGKLRVDVCHGPARLKAQSARVSVGRIEGDARIATKSGRIEIEDARGGVAVRSVSGNVTVHLTGRAAAGFETVSGTVRVSLPAGVRPEVRHRSSSGKLKLGPDPGDDVVITARSVSGDIRVASE
jgi:DUF4097 and DUF4098 domain-containing protein YvlB